MNFWHIQMSKGLQAEEEYSKNEIANIISSHNIIGTGEWRDKRIDQCKQFKQTIEVGDIVFVRNRLEPIALVEVEEKNVEAQFYENEHKVKLLALYDKDWEREIGIYEGQSQGTLTRVANQNNPTGKFIIGWYSLAKKTRKMKDSVSILKYKKQIILQGPPGTGKTKLAKEIARELLIKETITIKDIKSLIKIGDKIKSITDYTTYQVVSITSSNIGLQLTSGNVQTPTFDKIISAYKEKKWNGGTTGGDAYEAAIAKHIFQNTIPEEQFKLIQFHPAYSYEDFVRGISATSNGNQVEYKTEDKSFAEFAAIANKNWMASNNPQLVSQENWLSETIDDFKEHLLYNLENSTSKISITPKVFINRVTENSIRYNSDAWEVDGGVPISDLSKMYQAGVSTRKEVKNLVVV